MSRNDDGFLGGFRDVHLRRANHSIDVAACRIVDKRIVAIPERIAGVQNICVHKVNGDVAIRVCRLIVLQHNRLAIQVQTACVRKDLRRNSARRCTGGRYSPIS